jgi:type IV pilus assembly protein PilV
MMERDMKNSKQQRGIALIEVLVAVLLFALGILALVGLQASMNKNVTQAKLRGEASFLANELIGRMWVDQATLSNYAITGGVCTAEYANCAKWLASVNTILPSGNAEVTITGRAVDITLSWTLPGEAPSRLQLGANINE